MTKKHTSDTLNWRSNLASVFVDVRDRSERDQGHLCFATLVPKSKLLVVHELKQCDEPQPF
jgi:hypothetical protein